ncbi:hypothetical protein MS3_00010067 [Schistosoma haematobium]|uniref:Uncharacterized protein n=1 Tax=Schistosoma haematobium TaxID=6185 RepID=A0A922LUZ9_SCHHA|nr:hypothetical protein MS3_00010067 [Schistosoma haematobium]KAH9594112.1 hypothetical protein MS3_00010067 [Schistosoma haematobium]
MDYEMKMMKGTQQVIIQSSGQNQTITGSILETDKLERKFHLLIATDFTSFQSEENNFCFVLRRANKIDNNKMKLILLLVLLILLNIDLSKQIPAQLRDQSHENMDYEMKMMKGTQQVIIQSSGQNQTITGSILETDKLERKFHLLIATVIGIIDNQINGPNSP